MKFKSNRMNNSLGPRKRSGNLIMSSHKLINSFSYLVRRSKTCISEYLPPEYAKPTLYLVDPGSMSWGVMEMNIRMATEPVIPLWFMGTIVIQHYMDFFFGHRMSRRLYLLILIIFKFC